jgi:hypothetical protein
MYLEHHPHIENYDNIRERGWSNNEGIGLYRVIWKEWSIFWELIAKVSVRNKRQSQYFVR